MKKTIFMKMLMILILFFICCMAMVTKVEARVLDKSLVNYDNIKAKYEDDPDCIDELDLEEANEWLSVIKSKRISLAQQSEGDLSELEKLDSIEIAVKSRINELEGENIKEDIDNDETKDDMMNWSYEEIRDWLDEYDPDAAGLSDEVREAWKETIRNSGRSEGTQDYYIAQLEGTSKSDYHEEKKEQSTESPIYQYPSKVGSTDTQEQGLEDMIQDGEDFLSIGTANVNSTALQNFSRTMYNILLVVGIVVAVIVGAIIGLKLMASSVEEQAEAKKLIVPYIVGCVVLFGGFGIWGLVVTILQGI